MEIIKQQKKAEFRIIILSIKNGKSKTISVTDHKELTLEKLESNIIDSLEKLK